MIAFDDGQFSRTHFSNTRLSAFLMGGKSSVGTGGGYNDLVFFGKGQFSSKRTRNANKMSHGASLFYLNALFEASFFRAEHLTASEKYKFSRQKNIIREFCFAKLGKQGFALRPEPVEAAVYDFPALSKTQSEVSGTSTAFNKALSETSDDFTAFNELLEPVEICCQQATRRWNERKFLASKRQNARTIGNSLAANDETLEPSEIHSPQATGCWNRRKFVASVRQGTGTDGNSLPAFDKALEPSEIVAGLAPCSRRKALPCLPSFPTENSRGELEKHKNSQSLFASQTTAAEDGGKK